MQLALFETDDTTEPRAASVTRRWERVLELAPDMHDILWRGDWREAEVEHALLLTLLHPSDRKKVIGKGKDHEAVLRQCPGSSRITSMTTNTTTVTTGSTPG